MTGDLHAPATLLPTIKSPGTNWLERKKAAVFGSPIRRAYSSNQVQVTTPTELPPPRPNLVPRLVMSGAIPVLPVYAFVVSTG